MDFSSIQDIDFQILQWFNGSNNVILDQLVMALTSGFTWIPLYLVLFIIVMRNNETIGQIGLIVGCAFLCVLFADGIAEGIIKPLAERWRPSNDPLVKYSVQVVDNLRLKDYSFCSAHAANTMAIAVFFSLLVRSRMLTFTLIAWSLVNCWTRLYLGVHYPLDIVCGILLGMVVGTLVYLFFLRMYRRMSPEIKYVSNQYTCTGYDCDDIDMILTVLMLTLVYVILRAVVLMTAI